jgi:hypothetical protein
MPLAVKIPLTSQQREIIVGTILGDGSLEFGGYQGTRLQIKQKDSYKEYVFWLYEKLKNLCNSQPKQRKDNAEWYFGTRFLIELTEFYRTFYPKGKKIVPNEISRLINSPLALAVWYMDDGGLDWRPKSHYAFRLNTDSFNLEGVSRLKRMLKRNFGIESSIQNPTCRGKKYFKLYIGTQGRDKFLALIKPHLLKFKCFSHKLPPL